MKGVFRNISAALLTVQLIFPGCGSTSDFPFEIDISSGSYSFLCEGEPLGPMYYSLNGQLPLKNSFLFEEKDSLVCISSLGDLDIIAVFKGNHLSASLRLTVVNAGKGSQAVNELRNFILPLGNRYMLSEMEGSRISIVSPSAMQQEYFLTGQDELPWSISPKIAGDTLVYSLEDPFTPLILLPGEKLKLPRLKLETHPIRIAE